MAFVHDNQIKVRGGEQLPPILGTGVVDGVEHGGIGGKHNAGAAVVLVGAQVAQGHIRQIPLEVVLSLLDQGRPVGQEKDVGDPLTPAEHVGEAGGGSGLAGAGGHDQQMLPETPLHLFTDRADGLLLIIPVGDCIVDGHAGQVQALGAAVHELLQVVLAENTADLPLGAAPVVPEIGGKAVGGEHHGAAAIPALQTIGIQHRLLAADVGVLAGALGLHHGQGQAVPAEEHIVAVAHLTGNPGHALHGEFLLHVGVGASELPAHLLEVHVNIDFAGAELGKVLRVEGALLPVLLPALGVAGGKLLHLPAQGFNLRFLLLQQALLLPDFSGVHRHLVRGDEAFVKGALLVIIPIAIVNPLDELKQAPQGSQGVPRLHAPLRMHRQVAQLDDEGQLAPGLPVHGLAEALLMDEGLQVVLVGHAHGVVRGVHPPHRQLQRLAAAHGAQGRGGGINLLGFHAGGGKEGVGGDGLEEGEVGHGGTSGESIYRRTDLKMNHES